MINADAFTLLSYKNKVETLIEIFEVIKNKNDHCAYIHHELTTNSSLFTEKAMIIIYDEVLTIYTKILHHNRALFSHTMKQSHAFLQSLHQQENTEEENIETLLSNI